MSWQADPSGDMSAGASGPTSGLSSDLYGFQRDLSPRENEAVAAVRDFAETEIRPIADDCWERAEFPRHLIPGLAALGLFGPAWEESRHFESSACYRGWTALELARVDASVASFVGVQSGLAMGSIGHAGSAEQRADWLPAMARGEVVGAFGLTEPLSGSDSGRGLRTTAVRRGDTWTLDGAKRWIGSATFADVVVTLAVDAADGRVKGFLVPTSSPGFTATRIEHKTSLRTVQNADLVLHDVRVPETLRLPGIRSFRDVADLLRVTRADVAWQAVGVAVGAYEAALAYARDREQFGRPIASHQLVQDLLARSLGNLTAGLAVCMQVSRLEDAGRQREEHSALAKAFTTSRMRETVGWAREILGGNGILLDHGVARHFADAEALYTYEGTRDINSLIVGRAVTGHPAFAPSRRGEA